MLVLKWKESTIWDWLTGSGTAASISFLCKVQIPHITLCRLQHELTKRIQINNWFRSVVGLTDGQHSQMVLCEFVCWTGSAIIITKTLNVMNWKSLFHMRSYAFWKISSSISELTGVQSVREDDVSVWKTHSSWMSYMTDCSPTFGLEDTFPQLMMYEWSSNHLYLLYFKKLVTGARAEITNSLKAAEPEVFSSCTNESFTPTLPSELTNHCSYDSTFCLQFSGTFSVVLVQAVTLSSV